VATPTFECAPNDLQLLLAVGCQTTRSAMQTRNALLEELSEEKLQSRVSGAYNRSAKRLLSLALSVPLVVLLWPLFVLIAVAVAVDSGFPVLYRADRGGYRGTPFRIMKFRTMVQDADRLGGGTTALHDPRITRVGAFLRATKLDEIPQLINILKGEMAFVGPRPELLRYITQYSGLERYILEVRPGITDFSSITYINLSGVVGSQDADSVYETQVLQKKNALRLQYVATISPTTDLHIFLTTIVKTIQQATRHIAGRNA